MALRRDRISAAKNQPRRRYKGIETSRRGLDLRAGWKKQLRQTFSARYPLGGHDERRILSEVIDVFLMRFSRIGRSVEILEEFLVCRVKLNSRRVLRRVGSHFVFD